MSKVTEREVSEAKRLFEALEYGKYFDINNFGYEAAIKAIEECLENTLTPIERNCLIDRCVRGLKMNAIALRRGVNPSTISRNINRAKVKVAKAVMKENKGAWSHKYGLEE